MPYRTHLYRITRTESSLRFQATKRRKSFAQWNRESARIRCNSFRVFIFSDSRVALYIVQRGYHNKLSICNYTTELFVSKTLATSLAIDILILVAVEGKSQSVYTLVQHCVATLSYFDKYHWEIFALSTSYLTSCLAQVAPANAHKRTFCLEYFVTGTGRTHSVYSAVNAFLSFNLCWTL